MKRHTIALTMTLLATGCAPGPDRCPLAAQQKLLVISLYFGRDVPGRGPVTDAEWERFADTVLSRQFPDGFTVFDAAGQWRNPTTGAIARETTKVVQVALEQKDMSGKIESVVEAYKKSFDQVAVGVVSALACGSF